MRRHVLGFGIGLVSLWGASMGAAEVRIEKQTFGKTNNGTPVAIYTLTNSHGVEARIAAYGATVVSLKAPDRQGKLADVVLGFDDLDGYLHRNRYFGSVIGRYGNRIAKGKFSLGGREYTLARNNGENHLHGGIMGFDKVVWTARETPAGVALSYTSKDGEEGYPGNLSVTVTYTLGEDNGLRIDYAATTDRETVLNLSNHSYFNLAGGGTILNHEMMINANRFTPVDQGLIPIGELRGVKGTPMDFTKPVAIGARIDQKDEQLGFGRGYDLNWVINGDPGTLRLAAQAYDPASGRVMEVETTEPGVQFYTGNFLDGSIKGKGGRSYERRSAFCLETQHFPDSPNKPTFPTTVLKPGARYTSTTVYRFSSRQ
jgi:aldose 1-epimerase